MPALAVPASENAFDRGCLGKVRHASEAAATAALAFWVKHGTARSGDAAEAYECRFCGSWHIGH